MSTNETVNTMTNVVGDVMSMARDAIANPETLMDKVTEWLAHYGLKVVAALLVLIIGRIIARFLQKTIRKIMVKSNVDEGLVHFTSSISYVGLMTFVVIAALGQLGVQTASFIAVLGAATFAIGLALQGSLANFAAGVLMLIFKPFRVGNYIEGAGVAGSVMKIEIFTTTLKTPDNKVIIVPNAKLTSDNIVNYSQQEKRRVEIIAGCGYDDDVKAVKTCLEKMVSEESRVLDDPAPFVGIKELGDNSVNFTVRAWVKTADFWDVFFDLTEQVKLRFDAEGFNIPYPQRDVHIYEHKTE